MSILCIPQNIIKEIAKCFHSFLWNNTDRIKRNTLISDYSRGGLKMVDLECMLMALKASWIPRLLDLNVNQNILNEYLVSNGLTIHMLVKGNIVDCNMFPDDIFIPQFYKECIQSFNSCNTVNAMKNVHDFLTQPIWCNSIFTIKGKSLCCKNWIRSGIIWVKDLYDVNGYFLSGDELYQRLNNKTNWISEYARVRKAVERIGCKLNHKHYATYVNVDHKIRILSKNKVFDVTGQKSKFFYQLLIEKKCTRPYMEKSWAKQFDKEITTLKWENIYIRRVKGLPDKKLSEFVYKLLHNLIMCRKVLFKWKRCDNEVCPLCGSTETIKHIYFDCELMRRVWNKIGECLKLNITWEKIVLGFTDDLVIHSLRNLVISLILYARYKFWLKGLDEETCYINVIFPTLGFDVSLTSKRISFQPPINVRTQRHPNFYLTLG